MLFRGLSLDVATVVEEVLKFRGLVTVKQRQLEEAYKSLGLEGRLGLDVQSLQPIPLAEPFLVVTIRHHDDEYLVRREVVEVWDEYDFQV